MNINLNNAFVATFHILQFVILMDKKLYVKKVKVASLCKMSLVLFMLWIPLQHMSAQINLSTKRAKLEKVIKQLEKDSKYRFFYSDALGEVMVNGVQAQNEPINKVLDKLFSGSGIKYTVSSNVIYLSKASAETPSKGAQQPKAKSSHKVSGTVKDANGEPLVGVSVMVKGTSTGVVTDLDGNYSFTTDVADPVWCTLI
jgi:hypothetical protein